jgi:dipeptidase D
MNDHAELRGLLPLGLWSAFADLNAVPRPSKNEAAVSEFIVERGSQLGLETVVDPLGNVLIRKPATAGYENHPPIVLQSHLDMVWQKNSDCKFDFETQGIQMILEGDWVRAAGTTLGADNGIGVASILTVLASNSLKHPALECLFTIDEETGMTGAKAIDPTWLKGRILLNLDTEQDNELTIGCAGGADVTASAAYTPEPSFSSCKFFQWSVRGLTGGHSGMEIHLGRGNANKIMNRLLWQAARKFGLRLASIEGGSLRNAIPRESTAVVCMPADQVAACTNWLATETVTLQHENSVTDPQLQIASAPIDGSNEMSQMAVLPVETQRNLLAVVNGTLSGIYRMSPSIAGLVQTSNNLARVVARDGRITLMCLARSSVDSERDELTRNLTSVLELLGGTVEVSGDYPGWQPEPTSQLVQTMTALYKEMFNQEPHVAACHAGLECGIIGGKFPGMEMISFGPNILGAHSPDERVQVSSVQKFWRFFTETLARL